MHNTYPHQQSNKAFVNNQKRTCKKDLVLVLVQGPNVHTVKLQELCVNTGVQEVVLLVTVLFVVVVVRVALRELSHQACVRARNVGPQLTHTQ